MKKQLSIVGITVLAILLLDQIIKLYIKTHFNPSESVPVFGDWFELLYVENQGMAFGTTFGSSIWSKLALSIFRIIASVAIVVYFLKQWRKGVRTEFLFAIGLIFAGAVGNLFDSMFYDFIFPFDPCFQYNDLAGSGNFDVCNAYGIKTQVEVRHHGFLCGNVVDMFHFKAEWPSWVPWYDKNVPPGGNEMFPAIWNLADTAISVGVGMMILRNKKYFPKEVKPKETNQEQAPQ